MQRMTAYSSVLSSRSNHLPKFDISLDAFGSTDGSDEGNDDDSGSEASSKCCCSAHEPCSICTNNAGHMFINAAGVI